MPADAPRVLVVGDVATDVLVATAVEPTDLAVGSDTEARVGLSGGGSAANTACWLAAEGRAVTLVGAVGDDAAGTARIAELTAAGVHCALRRYPGATTGAVVVLTGPAERTMLCDRGANRLLDAGHVAAAVRSATDAAHLHLSGYPLFDEAGRSAAVAALTAARRAGLTTSVDAASSAPLRRLGPARFARLVGRLDVLLANLDEARVLVGHDRADAPTAARALRRLAGLVVVKCAAQGAVLADASGCHALPAVPATAVDATGAGDAFAAGLLSSRLAGADPLSALRRALQCGARAVAATGARPAAG